MPKIELDAKHRTTGLFSLDRVRLNEMNEKARILILDESPTYEYRHWIQSPEGERPGSYLKCLGNYDVVESQSVDEDRCPACANAEVGRDVPVSTPRRQFAMNVARYGTSKQGVAHKPLSLFPQIWVFGEDKYSRLVDRKEEHGDLRRKDIVLTCTSPTYQNLDIAVSGRCLAMSDDTATQQLRELHASKQSGLEPVIAKAVSFQDMEKAVSESGVQIEEAASESELDLDIGIGDADDVIPGLEDLGGVEPGAPGLDLDDDDGDILNSLLSPD